jgi:hypothetical protein
MIPIDDFILENDNDDIIEMAISKVARLSHSNLIENPNIAEDISEWLGAEFRLQTRNETLPVQKGMYSNLRIELTPELRQEWSARSRLDLALWRHVCSTMMPNIDVDALARRELKKSIDRYARLLSGQEDRS